MNCNDEWIILDTETTGLSRPVYPIEIGAQRMCGWEPTGEPFRMLVNFDAAIEPEAERLHGYSREYLSSFGATPVEALDAFSAWAGTAPIVAYNLSYDWDQVLEPSYERLGLDCSLVPGFCALRLVKSTVPGMRSYRLETVLRVFDVAKDQKHNALDDVAGVVTLFRRVIGPHLERNGIFGFDAVARCANGTIVPPPLPAGNARSMV